MARAFEGTIHVHYSQAYFIAEPNIGPEMGECFRGQVNGLCGAAVPGFLFLVTGLHTGRVGFIVDVLDATPPVEKGWEEIVEASFFVKNGVADYIGLSEWGGMGLYKIPLAPGNYRVRYCARGMEAARKADVSSESGRVIDSYALMFWPAEPAGDRTIKQTSRIAAYWHQEAPKMSKRASTPTPTPPPKRIK
jgi:hypothetical protein